MNAAQKAIMIEANEAYKAEVKAANEECDSKQKSGWKAYKESGAAVDSHEWKTLQNVTSWAARDCNMRLLRAKKAWYAARERALAIAG